MRDESGCPPCSGGPSADGCDQATPANQAEHLTALAREARLLEFGLDGDGDLARSVAADLESALSDAMDAESTDELTRARKAISTVLGRVVSMGMTLSAQLTDIEVDGILGRAHMPVLSAVLSEHA